MADRFAYDACYTMNLHYRRIQNPYLEKSFQGKRPGLASGGALSLHSFDLSEVVTMAGSADREAKRRLVLPFAHYP
jgi:hypothetical protein